MISDADTRQAVKASFPFLAQSSADQRQEFFRTASLTHLPAGRILAMPGDPCHHMVLVVAGQLRIYRTTNSGREITLYRISAGQGCVLTAACLMGDQSFPAIAETWCEVEVVLVPAVDARRWISGWPEWGSFVFGLVAQRLAHVIEMLEEVAFERTNVRIAHYLLARTSESEKTLNITHQQIADDLGTSREIVSRIVKAFESSGLVTTSRAMISILDRRGLMAVGSGGQR